MLLIECPWCGPRDEIEFSYGGEAHRARPAEPQALTDAEWAEFLFMRRNPKGAHRERWVHSHGCRRWFNVERHTVTYQILKVYPIAGAEPHQPVAEAEPLAPVARAEPHSLIAGAKPHSPAGAEPDHPVAGTEPRAPVTGAELRAPVARAEPNAPADADATATPATDAPIAATARTGTN